MSSLVPGALFETSGLNRLSTPVGVGVTARDISQTFTREPFNGHPWPRSSPVSRVYDIANTPTKLILLNNKKSRKYSHLRGHSALEADRIPVPDPDRHFSAPVSPVNKNLHVECKNSRSPRFTPTPTGMEWFNQSCRPPSTFSNGSHVNPRHHHSCIGHTDLADYNLIHPVIPPAKGPRIKRPHPPPSYLQLNLDDSGLTLGQRSYLWSIARIYSSDNVWRQKQQQYFELLRGEIRKGFQQEKRSPVQFGGHKSDVFYRYARYLESPRKTRCGKDERLQRSKSAPAQPSPRPTPRQSAGSRTQSTRSSYDSYDRKTDSRLSRKSGSKKGDDSSDVSSSMSSSTLSVDTSGYVPREGTLRPKSRMGRTNNQSEFRHPLAYRDEPLVEVETPKKTHENIKPDKEDQSGNTNVTNTSDEGNSDKNARRSSDGQDEQKSSQIVDRDDSTQLKGNDTTSSDDHSRLSPVSNSQSDHGSHGNNRQVITRKGSTVQNSDNRLKDSGNSGYHGNDNGSIADGDKVAIDTKQNSANGITKDSVVVNKTSHNTSSGRIGSAVPTGRTNSRKYSTNGSEGRNSSNSGNSNVSRTSSLSRKSSEGTVSTTSASFSAKTNHHGNKGTASKSTKEDSKGGSDDSGEHQSGTTTTTSKRATDDNKPNISSPLNLSQPASNQQIIHSGDDQQGQNSKNGDTESSQYKAQADLTKNDSKIQADQMDESSDVLSGRVSPLPSIGSNDLEPVDPELLEY